jgi:hypothetical protein
MVLVRIFGQLRARYSMPPYVRFGEALAKYNGGRYLREKNLFAITANTFLIIPWRLSRKRWSLLKVL